MTTTTTTAPVAGRMSHREVLTVLGGLMTGMMLAALDQTIVATALPTMVGDLQGLDHIAWIVTGYLLTSTAATPLFGRVSDLYGRKPLFQVAIVVFLVGSMLAGVAQTMLQLILARAVQGIGGGGLIALAQAIIGDIVSPRERGRYQGYMGAVFALASVAGPLLGGFLVDNLSWRWVFYINVPVGLVALYVTSRALRLPGGRVQRKVDYLGAALLVAAVTSLLLVTAWGGTEHPWTSPLIVALGTGGGVLAVLFVLHERRVDEPILPLRLFASRTFRVATVASAIVGASMFGAIIFLPVYLQLVAGASATSAGLLMLPLISGVVLTSILSGRIIARTGRYKHFPIAGTGLVTVAMFLLSTMDAQTSQPVVSAFMVLLGVGLGMVMQVLILAVQNDAMYADLGVATSAASFFRSLGGSVGTAVFGAILTAQLGVWLAVLLPAGAALDPATVQGSPAAIAALPPDVHAAVVEAFARAIQRVFLVAVPIAAAAFVLVWFLPERPLRESVGDDEATIHPTPSGAPAIN